MSRAWTLIVFLLCSLNLSAADKPNILFIFTDDQRFDAMSCVQKEQGEKGRFPWFQTPNMDRLAADGVRFRNAFVVNSLCSPSRAAFLTGRYNHTNGIINNRTPFPADAVTHASLLRAAGYCTGYAGKWHMGSDPNRPGFDWHASFTGQGRYDSPPILYNGKLTMTQGWADDITTDYAIRFLEKERQPEKPFLLVVGFKAPHGPFEPPARRKDSFAGETARVVPNIGIRPGFNQAMNVKVQKPEGNSAPVNLNYFRCIAANDDNLGRLLEALDRLIIQDNTLVIYTSDNGFYLGEHSLADKRSAYDESLKIPFIVRDPKSKAKGVVRDEMILNIDLAPTLLHYAGVSIPREMQGKSWLPLLSAEKKDPGTFRSAFFYEYFRESSGKNAADNPGGFNTPTVTGVRTLNAKLLKYEENPNWNELFDLASDPYEIKNLYRDPAHAGLRQQLEEEYARLTKELQYQLPAQVDRPQAPANPIAVKPEYVLDYDFKKDAGNKVIDSSAHGSQGTATNAALGKGRDDQPARIFNGDGQIQVSLNDGLKCAAVPFRCEVTLFAQADQGVILARGGATNGFALHLIAGKPTLTVNIANKSTTLSGPESIRDKWVTVSFSLRGKGELDLLVDGKSVARTKISSLIPREPNDGLQIGADLNSPVDVKAAASKFQGKIERVRIFRGE